MGGFFGVSLSPASPPKAGEALASERGLAFRERPRIGFNTANNGSIWAFAGSFPPLSRQALGPRWQGIGCSAAGDKKYLGVVREGLLRPK